MKRVTTAVDRLLVVLLGVALVGAGVFAIAWYFDAAPVVDLLSRFDRRAFGDITNQQWWQATLAGVVVLGALAALLLLIGNLSPRRTGTAEIFSDESLSVRVDLGALARGVAAELGGFPGVGSSHGRAIDDRGTATLAVTVEATAHIDLEAFAREVEKRSEFVAAAMEGAAVALRVQVHVGAAARPTRG